MNDNLPRIIIILGPNASGKSELGVKLAKKYSAKGGPASGWNGAEIVNADSRQIYRGFDLSSGKIEGKWVKNKFIYKGIPHHLIDFLNPKKDFSVVQYQKLANKTIKDILKRGKLPIIVGGTGFYIKAIVDNPKWPDVEANKTLRKKLEKLSVEKLFKILKQKDSTRAKIIDPRNKIRIIRALEIVGQLGKVPKIKSQPIFNCLQIGIYKSPNELKTRIKKRLEERLAQRMIKEIETLHKKVLSWKKVESFGLEFKYIAFYLQGKFTPLNKPRGLNSPKANYLKGVALKQMKSFAPAQDDKLMFVKKLNTEIWRYAKRQMTWFKRNPKIKWVKNYSQAEKISSRFIKRER